MREGQGEAHVDVPVGPGGVGSTDGSSDSSEDNEEADQEDSLLVDDLRNVSVIETIATTHVELGRDGSSGDGCAQDQPARLGPQRTARNGIDNGRGSLIWGRLCGVSGES